MNTLVVAKSALYLGLIILLVGNVAVMLNQLVSEANKSRDRKDSLKGRLTLTKLWERCELNGTLKVIAMLGSVFASLVALLLILQITEFIGGRIT